MLDVITILGVNAAIQHAKRKLYLFDKEILAVALDGTCTFDDGSDVMLEPEHLRDLKLQVQGRAPTFHAPKPMTTRDTQFAGFAKALYEELSGKLLIHGHPTTLAIDRPIVEQIIAQRAYDLVKHALDHAFTHTTEDAISAIPDLTQLPQAISIKADPSLPANTIRFESGGVIYEERL